MKLLTDKNVGSQGVITAADVSRDQKISADERLVITNKKYKSTAYIMALRLGINYAK